MSGMAEVPIHEKIIGRCVCGHSHAAHGTRGKICCACNCLEFSVHPDECPAYLVTMGANDKQMEDDLTRGNYNASQKPVR